MGLRKRAKSVLREKYRNYHYLQGQRYRRGELHRLRLIKDGVVLWEGWVQG